MIVKGSPTLLFTFGLLAILHLVVASESDSYHNYDYSSYNYDSYWYPHYYRYNYAQPRSFWSRARSIMPRVYDVAAETASSLLIPGLAILAIAIMWPEYHHYKAKRDVDDTHTAGARADLLLEHLNNVYTAAVESDQCLQRVVCELGATAASLKPHHRHLILKVVGAAAPSKYSHLFSKFKNGAEAERCDKLGCPLFDN